MGLSETFLRKKNHLTYNVLNPTLRTYSRFTLYRECSSREWVPSVAGLVETSLTMQHLTG